MTLRSERLRAARRGEIAREQFEQGGLAGAIGSDQHGTLAPLGLELQPAIDGEIAVGEIDVLSVIARMLERGGWGKRMCTVFLAERRLDLFPCDQSA